MKRIASLLIASGLLIAGTVAATGPAGAAKPPKTPPETKGNPKLTAVPNPIRFGTATAITGDLTGNPKASVPMTLQADEFPFEGAFPNVAVVNSANTGAFKFDGVRPFRHTQYRVHAATQPQRISGSLLVRVAISVRLNVSDSSPDRGERVTFAGTAKPAHDGALVSIQIRQSDGTYKTLATTVLKDAGVNKSSYEADPRISILGIYRVKVSGDSDHSSGYKKRVIEVEP